MRSDGTFVTEPQCDNGNVDAGLQHMHRDRMSNNVRRNAMLCKFGKLPCRSLYGKLESFSETDARQRVARSTGKQRFVKITRILPHPMPEFLGSVGP